MIIKFTSSGFALLLSIAVSALAGDIDDKTSCAVAARAFDDENAQMERTIVSYIKNTMDAMDSQHAARGETAIMAQFSDVGLANMAVEVVERCQTHKELDDTRRDDLYVSGNTWSRSAARYSEVEWELIMANEIADANRLFETITNLSIAQTQILEMLQEVIPALLEEQREMRSEMQQFHMQIARLTTLIEAQHTAHTTH